MTAAISTPDTDPALRQRDYLLRAAQALSADLDLPKVLARVIRTAVTMTGGQAGAIALRDTDGEMRVVTSFQLEERFEHFLDPLLDPMNNAREADVHAADAPDADAPDADAPEIDAPDADATEIDSRAADDARQAVARGADAAPVPAPIPGLQGIDPPAAAAPTSPAPLVRVAEPGTAIVAFDLPAGPDAARQVLSLPLVIDDTVLGRIFVFRSEGAAAFTPLDGDLLGTFADHAAVAIQNAETHMRLRARERRLAALVEHSPAGSLLLDVDGRVVSFNPAAVALAGRAEAELTGADARELLVLEDERGQGLALDLGLDRSDADAAPTVQGYLRRRNASQPPFVQVTVTPLPAPRGGRAGYVVDVVDLSGFKTAEDAGRAFLAGLSHELKTPLALIRGFAETLRYPQVRADERLAGEALDVILDETGHLTEMVDRLLLAARLEAGALALDRHLVDLAGEIARVAGTFARAYPDRAWTIDVPADLPPVSADPLRLRAVLENLLSNAVKYSDPGTPIRVDAAADPDGSAVRIRVQDRGIGIATEDQARVFERFVRATERGEGTGLGLYMSRAIARAHGGSLDVESALGRGSTFILRLPCEASEPSEVSRPASPAVGASRSAAMDAVR